MLRFLGFVLQTSFAGATLLTVVDQFALNVLGDNDTVSTETIGECRTITCWRSFCPLSTSWPKETLTMQLVHIIAGIRTAVLQPGYEEYITTIDSMGTSNFPQRMTLQIPVELIRLFVNSSGRDDGEIRAAAAVYYDLSSNILPSTRPGMEE